MALSTDFQPYKMEQDDEGINDEDDEEEDEDDIDEDEERSTSLAKAAITGRCVTLQMLISEKIIEPGPALLSLKYLGRRFIADLLPDGKIQMPGTKEMFNSPSAWAMHCKHQVNPNKKSGCGWASVLYKGKKLDVWKAAWFRKHRPSSPGRVSERDSPRSPWSIPKEDINETKMEVNGEFLKDADQPLNLATNSSSKSTSVTNGNSGKRVTESKESTNNGYQEEALNLSLKEPPPKQLQKSYISEEYSENNNNCSDRIIIKHAALKRRSQNVDINTLVECESFRTLGKAQPFSVSLTTNAMLLMDFHSHLTSSEVVGYLGGVWDQSSQHLSVSHAYPCKCRLADSHGATAVEEEIRQSMQKLGLSLVGWYHSHPYSAAHPSVKDIDCQMSYQLHMKGSGSTYYPCIGIIIAPYNRNRTKVESVQRMYMVMPPLETEPSDYGIPMSVKYSSKQNKSLTEEVLGEMKELADFYRGSPDWLKFRQSWQPSITYLDKIKGSLHNKLPEDQMENGTFLEYVQRLLLPKG